MSAKEKVIALNKILEVLGIAKKSPFQLKDILDVSEDFLFNVKKGFEDNVKLNNPKKDNLLEISIRNKNIEPYLKKFCSEEFNYFIKTKTNDARKKAGEICYSDKQIERDRYIYHSPDEDFKNVYDRKLDFYSVCLGFEGYLDAEKYDLKIEKKKQATEGKEEEEKVGIENLKVLGAEIIDQKFVKLLRNSKEFTQNQFYLAKQYKNCQWFGVLKKWDIERIIYPKIKTQVKKKYLNISSIDHKVLAVIHGSGGSGKSTLLRRLALDLISDDFTILWLLDNEFGEFINIDKNIESGFNVIRENENRKFLIIIEDWSSITQSKKEEAIYLLKQTVHLQNVGLIIGDRSTKAKPYLSYLYGDKFELSNNENEYLIDKIITINPQWKGVVRKIFTKKYHFQSTLFLLLFVIARVHENEGEISESDLSDPKNLFQNIIKSDVTFIAKKSKNSEGLAKALCYWACIYKEYKINISYETFIKVAEYYNNGIPILIKSISWNDGISNILERLKIYINLKPWRGEKSFIKFNHDILVDLGLSKVIESKRKWEDYGDTIKKELLDIITEKGDDISASNFLDSMIFYNVKIFEDKSKLEYINLLIQRKNKNNYPKSLIELCPKENLNEYAEKLWEIENYNIVFFKFFLMKYSDQFFWCKRILKTYNKKTHIIAGVALQIIKKKGFLEKELKEFCVNFLNQDDLKLVNNDVFRRVVKIVEDKKNLETELMLFHEKVLTYSSCEEIQHLTHIVLNSIKGKEKYKTILVPFSRKMLERNDLGRHFFLTGDLLLILWKEGILKNELLEYCEKALSNNELQNYPYLLDKILIICESEKNLQQQLKIFCEQIIKERKWYSINEEIFMRVLRIVANIFYFEKQLKNICGEILKYHAWKDNQIVVNQVVVIALEKDMVKEELAIFYNLVFKEKNLNKINNSLSSNLIRFLAQEQKYKTELVRVSLQFFNDISWIKSSNYYRVMEIAYSKGILLNELKIISDNILRKYYTIRNKNSHLTIQIALKISSNLSLKQNLSNEILKNKSLGTANLICSSMRYTTNEESVADFLKYWREYDWKIISNALRYFANKPKSRFEYPNVVINEIINDYNENRNKLFYNRLLQVNLYKNSIWKKESQSIINDWNKRPRFQITSILNAYKNFPYLTEGVCIDILMNWDKEIHENCNLNSEIKKYGQHLLFALLHPHLNRLSNNIAKEIYMKQLDIPLGLNGAIQKILNTK
jgi:hypothetical protein